MNQNPFQRLGIESVPYAKRRKNEKEAAKALANTPLEKAKAAKEKLWNLYLDELEKRRKILVSGPYAGTAEALIGFLKELKLDDGEKLIQMAMVWQSAPRTTRFLVLQLIDEAMVYLRVKNGMSPFDDPLPETMVVAGEETENAFLRIRNLLS